MIVNKTTLNGNLKNKRVFSVNLALKSLVELMEKVRWAKLVWSASNILRHSFVLLLALQKRLLIKDKLMQWRIVESDEYVLCKTASEKLEHLFF